MCVSSVRYDKMIRTLTVSKISHGARLLPGPFKLTDANLKTRVAFVKVPDLSTLDSDVLGLFSEALWNRGFYNKVCS